MTKLSVALSAASLLALCAATPASAAQILLNSSMVIGNVAAQAAVPGSALNQQTGSVLAGLGAYTPGQVGTITLDLGQQYDFGRIDFFSSFAGTVKVLGGNSVGYNGWGSWTLNSGDTLAGGQLLADAGETLGAQSLNIGSTQMYRYLQIELSPFGAGSADPGLDEFRIFDREVVSAVPEPATWAMLIAGFGMTGSLIRRSRRASAGAFA